MPHDFTAFESPARPVKEQRCAKGIVKCIINNNTDDGKDNSNSNSTDSNREINTLWYMAAELVNRSCL